MCRKRVVSGVLLAAALAVPCHAFDLGAIKPRGTLRVIACEGEQPEEEFSFKEGSKPGFEREIVQGFARLQHLKFEVVPVKGWDERIPVLLRAMAT